MTQSPHLENGIAAEPAMTKRDDIPAAELAARLRRTATEDWGRTELGGVVSHAVLADVLLLQAADMLERLASRPSADHEAVRQRAVEEAIAIVRAQPFYPDTHTGTRQQWVKNQIEAKLRAALRKPANEEGGERG